MIKIDEHPGRSGQPMPDKASLTHTCATYPSPPNKHTSLPLPPGRVRTGIFGRAVQIGFQSVEKALRHVAQTLLLAGYDDPRRTYGAKESDLPFRHLLKSYRDQDPAPQPQLALPLAPD